MAVTKYYADANGNYIGAFEGALPPAGSIEVPAPNHGKDKWNGTAWVPYAPVPQSVTRAQAKLALLQAGLLGSIQPAIDAISDDTQRTASQIEWDDRLTFERSNGTLVTMATALGMSDAQIDALFIAAAAL